MKFIVVSPRQKNGGSIALHALCKYLTECGHKAKVFYMDELTAVPGVNGKEARRQFIKNWKAYIIKDFINICLSRRPIKKKTVVGYSDCPVKGCKRHFLPFVSKNTIVIYPEVIYGNPLKARKVVRWLLYYNRYNDDAYDRDDMFVCYRDIFNDPQKNPDAKKLKVAYYDLNTYKCSNTKRRSGKCYVIRKGANRKDLPKEFDGIVLDNLTEKEKVEVMNSCEYCISYDTQTAYSGIAAICGCISIIVPEENKSRKDYLGDGEKGYGRAYGFSEEEISFAKETAHLVLEQYEEANLNDRKNVYEFAKMCEMHFGK